MQDKCWNVEYIYIHIYIYIYNALVLMVNGVCVMLWWEVHQHWTSQCGREVCVCVWGGGGGQGEDLGPNARYSA